MSTLSALGEGGNSETLGRRPSRVIKLASLFPQEEAESELSPGNLTVRKKELCGLFCNGHTVTVAGTLVCMCKSVFE